MNRFTRAWRAGVAAYREGVPPDPLTPTRSLSPSDRKFFNIITPISCLLGGLGGYYGAIFDWWPLMGLGIMVLPIGFFFHRRYFSR